MADFKINKKHDFHFDFEVDGKKKRETISIDMTDRKISQRLMGAEAIIKERCNKIKKGDFDLKSEGLPEKIETFEDVAKLTDEQIEDIEKISNEMTRISDEFEKITIEEVSNALNADVSPAFKYCSAFDVVDGEYFITKFIECLSSKMVEYLKAHPVQKVNYDNKPYIKKYLKGVK